MTAARCPLHCFGETSIKQATSTSLLGRFRSDDVDDVRPCAAVCAISTLNEKNIFFSDFALAAAKAKRRYPLPDPFQDSDVGKSGENSDVAKIDAKNKIVHENRPSRPVLLPLPSSAKSTSGSPADAAPLFKTRLMRLRRAKCDCVSVSPVIVARS